MRAYADPCPPPWTAKDCESLGLSHLRRGEAIKAIGSLQVAVDRGAGLVALAALAKAQFDAGLKLEAMRSYQRLVAQYPTSPARVHAETRLGQIQALLAAPAPQPAAAPAPPLLTTSAPPLVLAAPIVVPSAVIATPLTPSARPLHRRWWFWTLIGVAVAGAAVGTSVGVVAALRAQDGPNTRTIYF